MYCVIYTGKYIIQIVYVIYYLFNFCYASLMFNTLFKATFDRGFLYTFCNFLASLNLESLAFNTRGSKRIVVFDRYPKFILKNEYSAQTYLFGKDCNYIVIV